MTLSETVGEEIISVAICGGSFHSLPGLLIGIAELLAIKKRLYMYRIYGEVAELNSWSS